MEVSRRKIGRNVRAARQEKGLTQEQAGLAAGVPPSEVSRIEAAKRDPQVSTLLKLAAGIGVPPARFFDGIG